MSLFQFRFLYASISILVSAGFNFGFNNFTPILLSSVKKYVESAKIIHVGGFVMEFFQALI